MDVEGLVDDYVDAWNRQDLTAVLKLMDRNAMLYDAFWMEYCVGIDITQYMRDSFEDDPFWYERVSDVMTVEDSVVYRYVAHKRTESSIGPALFSGAEVMTLQGDKIIGSSDFYCNPDQTALKEVAKLAGRNQGVSRLAKLGLGGFKQLRLKQKLLDIIDQDQDYLDANLTQEQLADRIGCSVDRLTQIIEDGFGTSFQHFLDRYRVRHTRDL
jgi:AraC-like DNA-binding protein